MTTHHGEYKTPGGKLVAVDFSIVDGRLRNAVVHGDFFLYPDDALDAITASIDGLPTGAVEEEISGRIEQSIPAGTEWLGSSPQALAIAIRRGIDLPIQDVE